MTRREFEKLFKTLYLPLGMYALRIVENTDYAEDLVQDAFLKVWVNISSGTEIENFKTYMYRTVHNECIAFLRRQRETVSLDTIPEPDNESIDTSDRDARIWKAIDSLPEKCRMIFLLSKRDGLSNEEIAQELGISIKTVKNQMTKAFAKLRNVLAPGHKPFFLPFL